jgi:hypothetical protein
MVKLLGRDLGSIRCACGRWEKRLYRPSWFCEKLFEFVGMDAFTGWRLRAVIPSSAMPRCDRGLSGDTWQRPGKDFAGKARASQDHRGLHSGSALSVSFAVALY